MCVYILVFCIYTCLCKCSQGEFEVVHARVDKLATRKLLRARTLCARVSIAAVRCSIYKIKWKFNIQIKMESKYKTFFIVVSIKAYFIGTEKKIILRKLKRF